MAAHYAKRFESGNYEPSKAAERLPTLEGIFEVVKENAPDGARNLFDVGCFDGGLMDLATQSGLGTWGLEFQGPAAELAAKRHPGRIKTGALEGLDPPDGIVFDVVTAIGLIEHLREPETLLAFARKALRPGGILVVQTPNARSIPARTLGRYWPCFAAPEHIFYFDDRTLKALCQREGFTIQSSHAHWKRLRLGYAYDQFENFGPEIHRLGAHLVHHLPEGMLNAQLPLYGGEMIVVSTRHASR